MPASAVYEAHDEDWDEQGAWIGDGADDGAAEWDGEGGGGYAADWVDEALDDDDFGPGVTVVRRAVAAEANEVVATDLAVDAYLDPLALVNAWEGALTDFKVGTVHLLPPRPRPLTRCERQFMHPDRFLPPTEAPLSLAQRQAKAPMCVQGRCTLLRVSLIL